MRAMKAVCLSGRPASFADCLPVHRSSKGWCWGRSVLGAGASGGSNVLMPCQEWVQTQHRPAATLCLLNVGACPAQACSKPGSHLVYILMPLAE